MSDATLQILRDAVKAVPFSYEVPGGQVLGLAAVRATFDGTGAGGAFLPCVQILSAAGSVMAQTVGTSVAAGSSADVTFAPFLETGVSTAAGGIRFNVDNEGGWLEIGSGNSIPSGDLAPSGIGLKDTNSGGGIGIWDGNKGGGVSIVAGPLGGFGFGFGGLQFYSLSGGFNTYSSAAMQLQGEGPVNLEAISGFLSIRAQNDMRITPDSAASGTVYLYIDNLPTVNPGGSGRVWNNAGVLSIT